MSDYVISVCSTVDLDSSFVAERDIRVVPFHFFVDGKEYSDDFGVTYPYKKFYDDMEKGLMTKTRQVAIGEYEKHFRSICEEGKDIIHIALSSGISGTVQGALLARDMILEEYPNRKIIVIDSLAASSGFGLLASAMTHLRDEGMSIEDLAAWVEENKLNVHHWFFSTDLKYYVRGGRISKVSGFFGNLLHICPLLNVSHEGRLVPREKVRSVKNVEKRMAEKFVEFYDADAKFANEVFISNSDCLDYANAVRDYVVEARPELKDKIKIFSIGTTIGAHTGPGTVALFFWGTKRVD